MSTPYIGFGNDTLERQPKVKPGETFPCSRCGEQHAYEAADDGSTLLLFYRCQETIFLGAVAGRSVVTVEPDVSGSVDMAAEEAGDVN